MVEQANELILDILPLSAQTARLVRVYGTAPCVALPGTLPAPEGGSFALTELGDYCFSEKPRSLPAADALCRYAVSADGTVRLTRAFGQAMGQKPARRYDFDLDAPAADEMELHPVCGSFLEEATLPDSVQVIGSCAFYNCRSLRLLTVGSGGLTVGSDVFLNCFALETLRVHEKVDFALPYMNVALGVVSHEDRVIISLDQIGADDQVIVISGTTAETYLEQNEPDIKLQKFDTYAAAKTAFENGTGVAWANDNTEVIAYAKENPGYVVGISSLGDQQSIAPAVTKGNSTLLDWINAEIESLGEENFFHADYEATLLDTYGADYEDTLVIEGGATK